LVMFWFFFSPDFSFPPLVSMTVFPHFSFSDSSCPIDHGPWLYLLISPLVQTVSLPFIFSLVPPSAPTILPREGKVFPPNSSVMPPRSKRTGLRRMKSNLSSPPLIFLTFLNYNGPDFSFFGNLLRGFLRVVHECPFLSSKNLHFSF